MSNPKINEHSFHGFYSNQEYRFLGLWRYNNLGGFAASNANVSLADYPIHRFRAVNGAKPFSNNNQPVNSRPIKFKTEEDAFKWYKRTKYGTEAYNKLKLTDFCKNYFVIPESEFPKYKNYFHGMIKGYTFEFDYSIESTFEKEYLNDCECPSSSSSSSNRRSIQALEDLTFALADLLSIDYSEDELDNLISLEKTKNNLISLQNTQSECCYCPPCFEPESVKENIICKPEGGSIKIQTNIQCDTTKIFDVTELDKRIGALSFDRNFELFFSGNDDDTKDELKTISPPITLFKDNWKLNTDWKEKFIKNKKYFPPNATLINDPVLLFRQDRLIEDGYNTVIINEVPFLPELKFNFSVNLPPSWRGSASEIRSLVEQQKQPKESNNLGKINVNIESKNLTIVHQFDLNLYLYTTAVCYVESENKFLVFYELEINDYAFFQFFYNTRKDTPDMLFSFVWDDTAGGTAPSAGGIALITTNDRYKIDKEDEKHLFCPVDPEKGGFKLKKEKMTVQIDEQVCEIEVYVQDIREFTYDYQKYLLSLPEIGCSDYIFEENEGFKFQCGTEKSTRKWNFTMPKIKFITWQKTDFDPNNFFPPKVG